MTKRIWLFTLGAVLLVSAAPVVSAAGSTAAAQSSVNKKKSKKKARQVEKAIIMVKKKERKRNQPHALNFSALHLLHDPQGFAEGLFSKHLQNTKSKLNLEQKLLVLQLISRLVGLHKLTLIHLGSHGSRLVQEIFANASSFIKKPATLSTLVAEIDKLDWYSARQEGLGDLYEGLLEKNAQDTKTGAGQYFTSRALIQALVDVMRPKPGDTICDPACGTGGFLLAAHDYLATHYPNLDREEKRFLRLNTLHGVEIVDGVTRLCAMNLLLHGIGPNADEAAPPVVTDDSLRSQPGTHYRIVMTNPPFGKKSSVMVVNEEGDEERQTLEVVRTDFWATTSNKQLNFLQHVKSLLEINGRAAVVLPDNVLFEGGAGETIRRRLLHECDVHTLLRLPTGIFYAQGVKANVLFFDRKRASETPWTQHLWIYDLRTNIHFTLKTNRMQRSD